MAINDLPMLSALRTKMQWHQERQRVLAENVSNSSTPNFRPRDLVEPKFDQKGSSVDSVATLGMMKTSVSHMNSSNPGPSFNHDGGRSGFLTRPAGNSVNLEDGEEKFERVCPIARAYGAALVVGTIDEDPVQAQAFTRERKLAVAQRSVALLTDKYGIPAEDIGKRCGHYSLEAEIHQCPGSVFAGAAASEIVARHQDLRAALDLEVGTVHEEMLAQAHLVGNF